MQMVANHVHDMYIYSKVTMTCTYIPRLLNFQGFLHSKVTTIPRLPLQHSNQNAIQIHIWPIQIIANLGPTQNMSNLGQPGQNLVRF